MVQRRRMLECLSLQRAVSKAPPTKVVNPAGDS